MNIAPSVHPARECKAAKDYAMALHDLSSCIVVTKEGVTRLGSVQTGWGWLFNSVLLPNLFKFAGPMGIIANLLEKYKELVS